MSVLAVCFIAYHTIPAIEERMGAAKLNINRKVRWNKDKIFYN